MFISNLKEMYKPNSASNDKYALKEGFQSILNGSYRANNQIYSDLVDPNYDISGMLNNELARLNQKGNVITGLWKTKKRNDILTQSAILRRNATWRIVIVGLFAIVFCFGLVILKHQVPIFPDFVYDVGLMIILSAALLYMFFAYIDILRRDDLDYNQLKLPAPIKAISEDSVNNYKGDLVDLTALYTVYGETCVGAACCISGSTYNTTSKKCQ